MIRQRSLFTRLFLAATLVAPFAAFTEDTTPASSTVPTSPAPLGPLTDATAKSLFNARSCNACHAVDEMRIGPPLRAVAIRYQQNFQERQPGTVDWLALKIRTGGAGSWGTVPMVSNPRVTPEEARAMARWILTLDPQAPARSQ